MTVFLKSTERPWPSVRRPSSRICSSELKIVRVSLLDLVEQHHRERLAPHLLGELATLLVADVPGGAPNSRRDRVLLANSPMSSWISAVLVAEQELGERLGQLGLPDARTGRRR
jgi:hypothetical protein